MSYELIPAGESTFENIMHKGSSGTDNHFSALLNKDHLAQKVASEDYFRHWDNKTASDETKEIRDERVAEYDSLTRQYYNLATDLYEYGWFGSFHFCRFTSGEAFQQALARHEHYLAHVIGIKKGMEVLDVGCGVGGPAREIAKFTRANITGLNINEYQVERATRYAQREGLSKQLNFIQGDFMKIPFDDNTFDAVYAIEATVHAPSLEAVYSEIRRVLKPGGVFGVYEWVMTDNYDNDDLRQRQIRLGIEEGDGIANMVKAADALAAFKAAGFELLECEDLADEPVTPSLRPWYWPLDGSSWKYVQGVGDFVTTWRMSNVGRVVTHGLILTLETLRIAAPGTARMSESLQTAARALVQGGREKLFTPMFLMVGRKPTEA